MLNLKKKIRVELLVSGGSLVAPGDSALQLGPALSAWRSRKKQLAKAAAAASGRGLLRE
jgi:hypothetical protein